MPTMWINSKTENIPKFICHVKQWDEISFEDEFLSFQTLFQKCLKRDCCLAGSIDGVCKQSSGIQIQQQCNFFIFIGLIRMKILGNPQKLITSNPQNGMKNTQRTSPQTSSIFQSFFVSAPMYDVQMPKGRRVQRLLIVNVHVYLSYLTFSNLFLFLRFLHSDCLFQIAVQCIRSIHLY